MYGLNRFQVLLAPPEDKGSTGSVAEMDKESIIDYLNSDDDEVEPLPLEDKKDSKKTDDSEDEDDKSKDDEVDEDDELDEIEEDLEEPDDEKLELVTPVARREILKKYPNIFKDFPTLQNSYYREREFTEIFPTIPEAREAAEKASTLDKFEKDLTDGNLNVALQVIKNEAPAKFNKVVDNYLDILGQIDEKAQHHVIGNVLRTTILRMVQSGREGDDEALTVAAQVLNKWVFGSSKFTAPTKLSSDEPEKENEEKSKFEKEKLEFTRSRFEDAKDGLNTRVNNRVLSTIDANIDPKDLMGPYVKKAAIADASKILDNLISKDTRFKVLLDRLWDNAFKNNFNKDSLEKISQAYLSKSRTLLPSVIKTARTEALKGIGKRVKDDSPTDEEESKSERRSAPETRERKSTKNITNARDIPKGMSSRDFLMMD